MDAGMDGLDALMAELAAGYAPRSAYTCLPFRGGPGLGRDGALPTARSRLPACLTREQRPSPQARRLTLQRQRHCGRKTSQRFRELLKRPRPLSSMGSTPRVGSSWTLVVAAPCHHARRSL